MKDFGAFVGLDQFSDRGKRVEGMIHVSNFGGTRRIEHPDEVVKRGQSVYVKVMSITGTRIALSMKDADQGM
jgi:ATP-dependent RNA helicase DHX8/PRP22